MYSHLKALTLFASLRLCGRSFQYLAPRYWNECLKMSLSILGIQTFKWLAFLVAILWLSQAIRILLLSYCGASPWIALYIRLQIKYSSLSLKGVHLKPPSGLVITKVCQKLQNSCLYALIIRKLFWINTDIFHNFMLFLKHRTIFWKLYM